ncbi:hypothetical protein DV737_g5252, partial [Chaetothyriales sp. CBS 132003]
MGFGIAKLLISNDYTVTTCTAGRSQTTISRIHSASIKGYGTDTDFVGNSDIILSIVPPRDAVVTAQRVAKAAQDDAAIDARLARNASAEGLLYIDMNAISPMTSRRIAQIFTRAHADSKDRSNSEAQEGSQQARRMSLRQRLSSFASSQSPPLTSHISDGLTAMAILSFTTAHSQSPSLLSHLLNHLERYAPAQHKFLQSSMPKMPPKAYRWIDEMREIGQTFSAPVDEQGGGFSDEAGKRLFDGVAEVYRVVSEDTELGDRRQAG